MTKVLEMLRENTGISFLDSGGLCGRAWQRNRAADLEAEPYGNHYAAIGKRGPIFNASINIYHWLSDRANYNEERDREFRAFLEANDLDANIRGAEAYVEYLVGEGYHAYNTYNYDSALSQILQFIYWEDDDGPHALIQIHNGADVRGGYTDAAFFDVDETILDFNRIEMRCPSGCVVWYSDDGGYTFTSADGFADLMDWTFTEDRPDYRLYVRGQRYFDGHDRPAARGENTGVLYVEDNRLHCPCCGDRLEVCG